MNENSKSKSNRAFEWTRGMLTISCWSLREGYKKKTYDSENIKNITTAGRKITKKSVRRKTIMQVEKRMGGKCF